MVLPSIVHKTLETLCMYKLLFKYTCVQKIVTEELLLRRTLHHSEKKPVETAEQNGLLSLMW